ncbi:Ornithine carbamoyltransferase [Ceratobasidium theobromae]|uniref:ornithine carbamoyltransferase n=1 Tax=Ceratobasidium theobromae TaxID=1582974 RepID=A0A5N5QFU9_9AGAM|nr:Ornithine carbamoyltransferase [Ceratobasidium theobromae]
MKFAFVALALISSLFSAAASDTDDLKTLVSELTVAATQSERLAILDDDKDFVFDFLNAAQIKGAVGKGNGGQAVSAKTTTFPALIGNGLAMTVGFLGPCAQNTPHIHPRSAEMLILVAGDKLNTGTFQENGARFVENKLEVGQATIFPMGSIHFQQNLGCDPAIFVAGFANEDPGTLQIAQGFFQQLPPDTTSATLGELGVEEVKDISKQIPANIAFGVAECVKRCKIDRNSTFEFSEDVIKKTLKEQGILVTIASGSASSRSGASSGSNRTTSSNLLSGNNNNVNAGVSDSNKNDVDDQSFMKNKYHVLVIVLASVCAVLVIALIFAVVIALRARRDARSRGLHAPLPLFSTTGHGKAADSRSSTPFGTEKYAEGATLQVEIELCLSIIVNAKETSRCRVFDTNGICPHLKLRAEVTSTITPKLETLATIVERAAMTSKIPHLMTLADLSVAQINRTLSHSAALKRISKPLLQPYTPATRSLPAVEQTLANKTIALLFSKRSTRTRVAAETSAVLLGGRALFLGREDIQLGVNESARDTINVLGGMCQGVFARVGGHEEIEELAEHSPVPVINALSSLWHPTQILADILTLHEHAHLFGPAGRSANDSNLPALRPLTVTWLGDSSNVLHDILVALPRLGHKVRVGTPPQQAYQCPKPVWDRAKALGCDKDIFWTDNPFEAVRGADVVVTDTWISMGQEAEKAQRLKDFQGYQVTEKLCKEGGANPEWKFLHCLPRKSNEVDDEVFYGPRSLVFPEAENRKWTIMALFDLLVGRWNL